MKQILIAIILTVAAIVSVYYGYKFLPLLVNDKFRGSFKLTFNKEMTKSDLYAPYNLKTKLVSDDQVEITWSFDKKEFVVDTGLAPEYAILSGFRIYKNGYWYRDIPLGQYKFTDTDLYPKDTYTYSLSPLTFDNKIEGNVSGKIEVKTNDSQLKPVKFSVKDGQKLLSEGDSITIAENVGEGEGWASRVSNHFGLKLTNKGVTGSTSATVVDRVEAEISEIDPDIVTIAIGVNDVFQKDEEGIGNQSMGVFSDNLKTIIDVIKEGRDRQVVLLSIFFVNCCEDKQSVWNRQIRDIANSKGILFVDVWNPMKNSGGKSLLQGDLHPGTQGHSVIADAIIKKWEELSR